MYVKNYQHSSRLQISSEEDLQIAFVKYIRTHHPDVLFVVSGDESFLDSAEKRVSTTRRGYCRGTPDLIVLSRNSRFQGAAFELKTPWGNGVLSLEQDSYMKKLKKENFLCVVSNDLLELVAIITKYANDVDI